MDGIEYRTCPNRRIRDDHREIVHYYLRSKGRDGDSFPDGRAVIDQPIRLLKALNVVRAYFDEQEEGAA